MADIKKLAEELVNLTVLEVNELKNTLKDEYEKVKAQLTRKYGTPESYEYFLDPYYEGDGSELTALYSSHCKYLSVFKTNVGQIIVNMTSDAKVTIAYQDTINNSIKDAENESIADDDL